DRDVVLYLCDARRPPYRALRFLSFDQERTVPRSTTSPPLASTVMRLASISALRRNASSILLLISAGATRGFSMIKLLTPLMPRTRRTASSALVRWWFHSADPSSVTHPFLTVTFI